MTGRQEYTPTEARSKARWIHKYVPDAYGIRIVERFPEGTARVVFLNGCGMERSIGNLDEFSTYRDLEVR